MSRILPVGLLLVLAGSALSLTGAWRALDLGGSYWLLRALIPAGWAATAVGAFRSRGGRGGSGPAGPGPSARRRTALLAASVLAAAAAPAAFSWLDARGTRAHAVRAGGMERTYHLYAPPGGGPRPLVVVMHGFLQSWRSVRRLAGLERIAAAEGFLIAYPEGYRWSWNDGGGRVPAARRGVDDPAFLRALVEDVAEREPVDARRVYAIGFSNSAFLLSLRACELADVFAGLGLVAGGVAPGWPEECPGARPIPAAFVNGTGDPALSALEGVEPGPLDSGEAWAERNGCRPGSAIRDTLPDAADDGTRVVRIAFEECPPGGEVRAYVVVDGGHAWPGGPHYFPSVLIGRTSRDLDASRALWEFLGRRRLPATAGRSDQL